MNIPEVPGTYKPGDVVNGHILTERGHWVAVGNARAEGLRPRYLATEVSTVADPDRPNRELSDVERRAVQYEADFQASTWASPEQSAPHGPHASPQTHASTPSAAGSHYGATPAHPTPGHATPGHATPAHTPAGTRPAAGGPTPVNTTDGKKKKSGCGGCLVVLAVVVIVSIIVFRLLASGVDSIRDSDALSPAEPGQPITGLSVYELTEDEIALIELSDWEAWDAEYATFLLLSLEAPELDRFPARVSAEVHATDADGTTHTEPIWIVLQEDTTALTVRRFAEKVDVVDVAFTVESTHLPQDASPYEGVVENVSIGDDAWPTVIVEVVGSGGEAPGTATVIVVVRDDDGAIINLATKYVEAPAPGQTLVESVMLTDNVPVPDGSDIDVWLSPY